MKYLVLSVFVPLLVLAGCKSTQQYYFDKGYREVVGVELTKLYSGKRAVSDNLQQSCYEDGKVSGSAGGTSYSGSWYIDENGRLCTSSLHQQANVCESVFIHENGKIVMVSTTGSFEVELLPVK